MSKNKHKNCAETQEETKVNVEKPAVETQADNTVQDESLEQPTEAEVREEDNELQAKVAELEKRVAELEDQKLRQIAEFDNYRRRTNKEKLDLLETAGERIFKEMLPLVDDFERAKDAMQKTDDVAAIREGIELIYNKFIKFLDANNVHPIDTDNVAFSTDEHEAITTFAAGEDKKGKIIDCTQKGYKLGDKVIRFAKVVVGE